MADLDATMRALRSRTRREILARIWDRDLSAGEIAAAFALTGADDLRAPGRPSSRWAGGDDQGGDLSSLSGQARGPGRSARRPRGCGQVASSGRYPRAGAHHDVHRTGGGRARWTCPHHPR